MNSLIYPKSQQSPQPELESLAISGTQHKPMRQQEGSEEKEKTKPDSAKQLMLGFIFGVIFGFLLQKGGVVKYEVLMGALFLTDFTVMKIMLTSITVGMIGIFSMHAL